MSHPNERIRQRPGAGFTLIELLVTMAIVALLAALAYPSYQGYVLRGQIVNATDGLSALQANMERYYQDNRSYAAINGFTPPCSTSAVIGNFTISCTTAPTSTAYVATAVGNPNTIVSAFTFSIDQLGNQSSSVGAGAPSGWTNCTTGWETKPGQC